MAAAGAVAAARPARGALLRACFADHDVTSTLADTALYTNSRAVFKPDLPTVPALLLWVTANTRGLPVGRVMMEVSQRDSTVRAAADCRLRETCMRGEV
jgi:hypothetical protein